MKTLASSWPEKVGDMVNRKPGYVVVFYTVIYFALTLPTAARKPFWYDELFTWATATRDSFAEVLGVLRQGWDLQPPLYFLLVRAGRALADSELGFRLPSVVGLWLGSLCLFFHLRRLIPPVFAASALFLPWATMVAPLAVEARPYALLFCFASAALFFWSESLTAGNRLPLAGLFLSLVAVSTVHYYGFTAFVALGAGELVHTVMRRRVRWGVLGLMALACVPAALHWPLVHEAMQIVPEAAWNAPRLSLLTQIYFPGKNNVMMGLLALVLTGLLSLRGRNTSAVPGEIVAAWMVTILAPAIGLVTAFAISGMITERYVLFWHAGVIATLLYGAARLSRRKAWVGILLLGLTAALFLRVEAQGVRRAARERRQMEQALAQVGSLLSEQRYQTLPLVVTDVLLAFQVYHYAPPSVSERLVYVADGDLQPPGSPHYTIDQYLPLLHERGLPWPVREAAEFYRESHSFLLAYAELWGGAVMIRIREHGCSLAPAGVWSGQTLYLVENCH
jgi:hypothetical protein